MMHFGKLNRGILFAGTAIVLSLGATFAASAQDANAPATVDMDAVIGTIGDEELTNRDIAFALTELEGQLSQVPAEQRQFAALMALLDIKLLAKKADAEGVSETDTFKERLAFLRQRALHNSYFENQVVENISDEAVRARYDKEVSATPASNETRARHILLKTEEEAVAVIKELQGGADFETLAKEKSTGPSAPQGGDLGYFGAGRMVPEFDSAANAMDVGAFSQEPVQTQFGFHVIKIEDRRPVQPPPFDQVKGQIRSVLVREKYFELMQGLREDAAINITDPNLQKAYDAATQEKPEAAAQ